MKIKTIIATSVAAVSLLASSAAFAGNFTGNAAMNSNYLYRGQTQSADLSTVSGGIDWSDPSGVYLGGWTSSLGGNDYELDLYGGYGFTVDKFDLDVGFINYRYPVTGDAPSNLSEAYVNASMLNYTAGIAITLSKDGTEKDNDIYLYGKGEFELKQDLNLTVTVGSYNFDDSATEDYFHVQAALSKGDFTFAVDKNDDTSGVGKDAMRLTVSYGKSIDF